MRVQKIALLAAFSGSVLMGQSDPASPTFAMTPAAIAAGTPSGVAVLSPHEAVNLFNGNLSFEVPLHSVEGRGKAGYTMVVPIGTKWTIENDLFNNNDYFVPVPSTAPETYLWPSGYANFEGAPGQIIRRDAIDGNGRRTYYCTRPGTIGDGYIYIDDYSLTKFVWVEANGTEHEFLDAATGGSLLGSLVYTCNTDPINGGPSRGTVFESDEATGATFIADNTVRDDISESTFNTNGTSIAGWLIFKDGTRYYSDTNGRIVQIIDRSGNQTSLSYPANQLVITDSMGRTTTANYANLSGGATPPVYDTIAYGNSSGGQGRCGRREGAGA
jgi:YD repeat-containing protein